MVRYLECILVEPFFQVKFLTSTIRIFLLKEEYEALSKKEKKQFKGHLQAVEALCNRFSSIENT